MPAELFDSSSAPAPAGGRRGLTVTTSIVIHAVVLGVVIVGPLLAGVSVPAAMARIDAFVVPDQLPMPDPPRPVTQAPPAPANVNPNAAPIEAPREIPTVEAEPVPPGNSPPIPGLPIGFSTGAPPSLGSGSGTAMIAAPPPEPKPQGPVRVGGVIAPPRRLSYVTPVYPTIASAARIEGTVILEAIIDESGRVTNLRVLKSVPMLDEAAKQAVLQWRYTPTTLNGKAVPVIMNVTVTFTLR